MCYIEENVNNQELFIINYKNKLTNYIFEKNLDNVIDYTNFSFYLFEVFKSLKKNEVYIITKEVSKLNIYTITIKCKNLFKVLDYTEEIIIFKYYTNNIDKEFLLASISNKIFIYNILDNFNLIFSINSSLKINNILLIFNIKRENCLLYSHDDYPASLTNLRNKEKTIKILNTKNCKDKYMIYWHNNINKLDYLILLCENKVLIINIFEDEIYSEIITESIHFHGYIYHKNHKDYLFFSSFNGYITIYDLNNKYVFKNIFCPKCLLMEISHLSDRYIVSSNYNQSEFIIIDLELEKIINSYRNSNKDCICNVKIIDFEKVGKCILTCGTEKIIHLWRPLL